jgi:hypothetical protein
MKERYVLTIRLSLNDILKRTYDNEKEARKVFHNAVSEHGLEFVTITKELA